MPGEALEPKKTRKKVPHGGEGVMVWGCITKWGVGRLCCIDEKLTSPGYVVILMDKLLGTLKDKNIDPQSIYFQRDKDRKQWTNLVMKTLDEHSIDSLPWPANSPDMNIIENLWDHLDREVHKRVPPPRNKKVLWKYLEEEWEKIDQKYIDSLYDSIPTRIQRLVEQKGGNTEY